MYAIRSYYVFNAIQTLVAERKLLAYHDRSDGGLFVTLAEMAFAGKTGIKVALDQLVGDDLAVLFNEELGAVIQVRRGDKEEVMTLLAGHGLSTCTFVIGAASSDDAILV